MADVYMPGRSVPLNCGYCRSNDPSALVAWPPLKGNLNGPCLTPVVPAHHLWRLAKGIGQERLQDLGGQRALAGLLEQDLAHLRIVHDGAGPGFPVLRALIGAPLAAATAGFRAVTCHARYRTLWQSAILPRRTPLASCL